MIRALLLLALLTPAVVRAAGCEDPDAEAEQLSRHLFAERRRLEIWSWSWGSAVAAAGLGQVIAMPFVQDRATRIDLAVGTIAAAVGATLVFVLPLRYTLPARDLERSGCPSLSDVEALLDNGAMLETLSRGWLAHVGNVAINGALFLILGVGFGHWTAAIISAVVGLAVGEAQLWTRPAALNPLRERHRAQKETSLRWSAAPLVAQGATGVGFALSF